MDLYVDSMMGALIKVTIESLLSFSSSSLLLSSLLSWLKSLLLLEEITSHATSINKLVLPHWLGPCKSNTLEFVLVLLWLLLLLLLGHCCSVCVCLKHDDDDDDGDDDDDDSTEDRRSDDNVADSNKLDGLTCCIDWYVDDDTLDDEECTMFYFK